MDMAAHLEGAGTGKRRLTFSPGADSSESKLKLGEIT